jgi:thymidylate synthase (FAD)
VSYTINVLDHGFVKLRNLAGPTRRHSVLVADHPGTEEEFASGSHTEERPFDADDTDVANAARLSFEGQDKDRTYDAEMKLNRYLLSHRHMTPFEVIIVWLEIKAPIFVSRQLVRQRTQSINEASARYITLPAEWYIPQVVGGKPVGNAKQGQSDTLDTVTQKTFKDLLDDSCKRDYHTYLWALEHGVAPEHARMFLHLNHYVHWMTTQNLRNLLISFLSLRDDPHAQIESQVYARATIQLLEPHLPGLMSLYHDLIKA